MSRVQRLVIVLALNAGLVAALVTVGLAAHSLGVFAAGADCLADAAAVGVSLLAIRLAALPPSPSRPLGYRHATNVAALVNAGWLLILYAAIAVVTVWHLAAGTRRVEGLPVLIVSAVAAIVLLVGALVLGGDPDGSGSDSGPGSDGSGFGSGPAPGSDESSPDDGGGEEDLNVKAVLLDTAADAAASAGVAVSGAVIFATGSLYWLDPATALLIALVVGYHAAKLVAKVTAALRSTPG
ncbi:MAG: cation transporter [Nocardiopsaceae bacterium]|nr:cation transporter [Nocardiopsaceae bacterium]